MSIHDVAMVWLLYTAMAVLAFALLPVWRAVAASYLGGWLLLPVGVFPPGVNGFTVTLIGNSLPAVDMLVTKAWIAPMTTLALAVLFAPRTVVGWRPGGADLPIALWCIWPLIAGLGAANAAPAPIVSGLYLAGVWGAPWLLGRLFFADSAGAKLLVEAIANTTLLLVPAALVEWITGPFFYVMLYGEQPMAADGAARYIGHRPLLFAEHGNQTGMVIAMGALAAVVARRWKARRFAEIRAAILVAAALLSQSLGAILLLAAGIAIARGWVSMVALRKVAIAAALTLVLAAPVYLSGVVPVERLVRQTAAGQGLLAVVRATGRGSIAWRVSQDQRVLPLLRAHPLAGTSEWDWWRPVGTRPWGLALLIMGQFGLAGLSLCFAALLLPAARVIAGTALATSARDAPIGLALIVGCAVIDSLLNTFVYLPAILAAAAITNANQFRRRSAHDAGQSAETDQKCR